MSMSLTPPPPLHFTWTCTWTCVKLYYRHTWSQAQRYKKQGERETQHIMMCSSQWMENKKKLEPPWNSKLTEEESSQTAAEQSPAQADEQEGAE